MSQYLSEIGETIFHVKEDQKILFIPCKTGIIPLTWNIPNEISIGYIISFLKCIHSMKAEG